MPENQNSLALAKHSEKKCMPTYLTCRTFFLNQIDQLRDTNQSISISISI